MDRDGCHESILVVLERLTQMVRRSQTLDVETDEVDEDTREESDQDEGEVRLIFPTAEFFEPLPFGIIEEGRSREYEEDHQDEVQDDSIDRWG